MTPFTINLPYIIIIIIILCKCQQCQVIFFTLDFLLSLNFLLDTSVAMHCESDAVSLDLCIKVFCDTVDAHNIITSYACAASGI